MTKQLLSQQYLQIFLEREGRGERESCMPELKLSGASLLLRVEGEERKPLSKKRTVIIFNTVMTIVAFLKDSLSLHECCVSIFFFFLTIEWWMIDRWCFTRKVAGLLLFPFLLLLLRTGHLGLLLWTQNGKITIPPVDRMWQVFLLRPPVLLDRLSIRPLLYFFVFFLIKVIKLVI